MKLTVLQEHLAKEENLFAYTIAGIVAGILSSLVIVLFKAGWGIPTSLIVPDGSTESFTSLPPLQRLLLPIAGAVILGLAFHWLKLSNTRSG